MDNSEREGVAWTEYPTSDGWAHEPTDMLEMVIYECAKRSNHPGGKSYDHVKASGVLPYLQELARLRKALSRIARWDYQGETAEDIARSAIGSHG